MNNQESSPLDDVLDYYLLSSQETGIDTLPETIKQYPQYEQDLRELSAFKRLQDLLPERAYTDHEETALKDQAVSIVQAVLHEKHIPERKGMTNAEILKPEQMKC